ncbi:MAG: AEC family transporter [Xenococcaceae cyanobacterium]
MDNLGIQKIIPLALFVAIGYILKGKFEQSAAVGAIKTFIVNVALPTALVLSIIKIDTRLGVLSLPIFGLSINFYLLGVAFVLARFVVPRSEKAKARSLILMFASLAPGLTVYPFTQEFLGQKGLAWAALVDVGNKLFVLIGLYVLALYWQQRAAGKAQINSTQFKTIGLTLLREPANLAVILGLLIVGLNMGLADIPGPILEVLQRLAACATPLILFFVGISLEPKASQFQEILSVLLLRSAAGFWFSAGAIALLNPDPFEAILFTVLPQSGCSLWPLLYASQMNTQEMLKQGEKTRRRYLTFDTEFALGLLTTSIPLSICINLTIFSSGSFFNSPLNLGLVGSILLAGSGLVKFGQPLGPRASNYWSKLLKATMGNHIKSG